MASQPTRQTVQIITGNPLASRWQCDSSCPEETPVGYFDQWFEYNMDFLVPANTLAAVLGKPTVEIYCDSPRWKTEGYWSSKIRNLGDIQAPPSVEAVIEASVNLLP